MTGVNYSNLRPHIYNSRKFTADSHSKSLLSIEKFGKNWRIWSGPNISSGHYHGFHEIESKFNINLNSCSTFTLFHCIFP